MFICPCKAFLPTYILTFPSNTYLQMGLKYTLANVGECKIMSPHTFKWILTLGIHLRVGSPNTCFEILEQGWGDQTLSKLTLFI